MTPDELAERLDGLGWDEQVDFELRERYPNPVDAADESVERKLQELAHLVTPALLTLMEARGYAAWVLRLSPYVLGDDPPKRARRYLDDPNPHARHWAAKILKK